MIAKFNKFINESLLDKMKGKNEEQVWKDLGFSIVLNTEEEVVKYMIKNFKKEENSEYIKYHNDDLYFIYYKSIRILTISPAVHRAIVKMFNLTRYQTIDVFERVLKRNIDKIKINR